MTGRAAYPFGVAARRIIASAISAVIINVCAVGGGFAAEMPGEGPVIDVSFGVGMETTGAFRGVRSRDLNPAVYGYAEFWYENFYLGGYTNPVRIAGDKGPLVVSYIGYNPRWGDVAIDIGVRNYAFVGIENIPIDEDGDDQPDRLGNLGLFEGKVAVTKYFSSGRVSARFFVTPDMLGETGAAYYLSTEARKKLPEGFELRADISASLYDDKRFHNDYADYGVSLHKSLGGFDMFVRYSDTAGLPGPDNRLFVFGIEKSFGIYSSDSALERRMRKIYNSDDFPKSLISPRF